MRSAALILLLLFFADAHGLERDKKQHIAVSAMIAMAGSTLFEKTKHPEVAGFAASMAVGIAKELYDKAHPKSHKAEVGDLAADALGATVGAFAWRGITLAVGKDRVSVGISKDF